MPKGMVIKKMTPKGEMYRKQKVNIKSTDITYATKITAGKRKFTAASLTSIGEKVAEEISVLLGKNADDFTVE
jgi:hypothetical protein